MVNKPLIRPYFWGGGYVRGGRLTSHNICGFSVINFKLSESSIQQFPKKKHTPPVVFQSAMPSFKFHPKIGTIICKVGPLLVISEVISPINGLING